MHMKMRSEPEQTGHTPQPPTSTNGYPLYLMSRIDTETNSIGFEVGVGFSGT